MASRYNTNWKFNTVKSGIVLCLFFSACTSKQYYLHKNSDDQPIVKPGSYTFNKPMTAADTRLLDTNALYLQVFDLATSNEYERANPAILKFHNDGYYKVSSRKFYGRFDKERTKQSAYYGGKFYLDGEKIMVENFYPSQGGKTNYYVKEISKGSVKSDTIKLIVYGTEHVYVKKTSAEIFN